LDHDLTIHRPDLAAKVSLIAGLDLRLVCIDPDAGRDDFHVLQGLRDDAAETEECCYAWQRWGATGSRGGHSLDGPHKEYEVTEILKGVFLEKSGAELGSIKPGDQALEGKYWLQPASVASREVQWQYYVADGVDGKKVDWYPYTQEASLEMEEIYAQHKANEQDARTAVRIVNSGYFSYTINLTEMHQTNTKTKKQREIRRAEGAEIQAADAEAEAYAGKKKAKPAAAAPVAAKAAAKGKVKAKVAKAPKPVKPVKPEKPLRLGKVYSSAAKKAGMRTKQVRAAMEAVLEIAAEEALKWGKFRLAKAINMKLVTKPAREEKAGINPFTKEPCIYKAKPEVKTIKAKPSSIFVRTLSKPKP